jgi:hypothetical protein
MTRLVAAPSGWALRAVLVAGVLLALLAGVPSGLTPSVVVVVVVTLGALLTAVRPEGLSGVLTLGIVVVFWTLQLRHEVPGAVLVAAAGLVTAHVAATVLAYGPPWMPVAREVLTVWAVRGVLIWLAAPVVWFVARVYADRATPTTFWLAGLAAALVAAVVAAVVVPTQGEEIER